MAGLGAEPLVLDAFVTFEADQYGRLSPVPPPFDEAVAVPLLLDVDDPDVACPDVDCPDVDDPDVAAAVRTGVDSDDEALDGWLLACWEPPDEEDDEEEEDASATCPRPDVP